jgi:orotate phosphoribosyltransferase
MTNLAQRAKNSFKKHGASGHPGASGEMETNVLDLLPIRRGHFRFESGYHGEIWLDLDQLFANPRRIAPLARELAGRLSGHDVEAVVGPLVGGALLAQMIAAELEAQFAYAEPQPAASDDGRLYPVAYRLPNTLAPLLKGKRVAIVDDAINAGSALRATFHALVAEGAKPAVAGALIVLSDTARPFLAANGLQLEGLVTLATPLWSPEVCPLCARQAPLDSPP